MAMVTKVDGLITGSMPTGTRLGSRPLVGWKLYCSSYTMNKHQGGRMYQQCRRNHKMRLDSGRVWNPYLIMRHQCRIISRSNEFAIRITAERSTSSFSLCFVS
ncbi:hypothetical protein BDEG_22302 [Batrachochytrium dendrobatidis JEL423]|uniref:Uncharacterized protein n=1 Tax=Batrachochytrium dendrobatidis (strain JEL423) TaxID=403673 RepID=A0A177WE19_BATDL|nr:hypothetical protein BDEG_22297 [Batrachochytrium dendrobatidis JEL423]OAJ38358.1 hypothetical protein BDEG_22302 [Batrachochytrium dendrobatidis JEL423]